MGRTPLCGSLTGCEYLASRGPLLEVFKWVLPEHSEVQAIQAVAAMQIVLVVDFDSTLAIAGAPVQTHQARLEFIETLT